MFVKNAIAITFVFTLATVERLGSGGSGWGYYLFDQGMLDIGL